MGWLEDAAGPNFVPAVLWTLLALVILVIVLVIIRIVRSMTFGTFVAGGRNRKTRLAVMDAAAIDSQRRLVLVRRDDIEHLILIGGPTDVVVERDIRLHSPVRRPSAPTEPAADAQARARAETPAVQRAEPRRQPVNATKPEQPPPPQPAYRTAPPPPAPSPPPAPARTSPGISISSANLSTSRPPQPPASSAPAAPRLKPLETGKPPGNDLVDASRKPPKPPELSLEDEMNRLLGELSTKK